MQPKAVFVVVVLGVLLVSGVSQIYAGEQNLAKLHREEMLSRSQLRTTEGELFTWHARYDIDVFIKGYKAFGDTRWLDEAVLYYDFLISKLETAPDGYKGWIGPHISRSDLRGSHVVGDANLIEPMLAFAEVVYKDPALRKKYQDKADEYIALAKHIIEKWDKRGCWEVAGPYAQYTQQTMWMRPDNPDEWVYLEDMKLTENLNKSGKWGVIYLRLYMILGDPAYKKRAEMIFGRYKQIMRYYPEEDRYVWNFWEPFGPWDMNRFPKGWVDVHPNRPHYQAAEAEMMAEAYHTGVVFTEEDMRRIVNTNLWMWNGSWSDPKFVSADGNTDAGCLWSGLADFDPTIRKLYEQELKRNPTLANTVRLAYLQKQDPPSYERDYVRGEVALPHIPIYSSPDISMAVAIPTVYTVGSRVPMRICSQVRAKGQLNVDLYNTDGTLVRHLFTENITRADTFYTQFWRGKDPKGELKLEGEYRIRWTLNNSIREVPIILKPEE